MKLIKSSFKAMQEFQEYKDEYVDKMIKYFEDYEMFKDKIIEIQRKDFIITEEKRVANSIPDIRDFLKTINITYHSYLQWLNEYNEDGSFKYPDLHYATQIAKEIIKLYLIKNGTLGLINPQFSIFAAKNLTDMRDKQEVALTGDKANPIIIKNINELNEQQVNDLLKRKLNASAEGYS